jgi:hypothetical protein
MDQQTAPTSQKVKIAIRKKRNGWETSSSDEETILDAPKPIYKKRKNVICDNDIYEEEEEESSTPNEGSNEKEKERKTPNPDSDHQTKEKRLKVVATNIFPKKLVSDPLDWDDYYDLIVVESLDGKIRFELKTTANVEPVHGPDTNSLTAINYVKKSKCVVTWKKEVIHEIKNSSMDELCRILAKEMDRYNNELPSIVNRNGSNVKTTNSSFNLSNRHEYINYYHSVKTGYVFNFYKKGFQFLCKSIPECTTIRALIQLTDTEFNNSFYYSCHDKIMDMCFHPACTETYSVRYEVRHRYYGENENMRESLSCPKTIYYRQFCYSHKTRYHGSINDKDSNYMEISQQQN